MLPVPCTSLKNRYATTKLRQENFEASQISSVLNRSFCMLVLVVLKVAKYNLCKDFGFNRGNGSCRSTLQDPWCSHILQQVRVVH